jgi:hypothetical protein
MKKTTANNKPAGNKRTLASLKAKPFNMPLVHPTEGETGGYVTLIPKQCNAYFFKAMEIAKFADKETTLEENMRMSAELLATVVIGWDEEVFGQEFTTDAVVALLMDMENFWIRNAIEQALDDTANFFPKP